MKTGKKRVLVIGIDQSIPYLLKRFMSEGFLPNIKTLVENGVYTEAFSCPPCDTPTNWTTIATGATTAIHGTTSFYLHLPGEPFEKALDLRSRSELSKYCEAEYIWDVADRNGLTPFVINYPAGWPSNFKKGVMAVFTWPIPESLPRMLGPSHTFNFKMGAKDPKLNIKETKAVIKDFTCHSSPLQISIAIDSNSIQESKTLDAFIIDKDGSGYNNLVVETSTGKQLSISMDDEWSDWISLSINTEYGTLPCLFKLKIHHLSPDGKNLRLRHSALYNAKGWITPESIAEDFIRNVMNYELTFEEKKVEYMITGRVSMFLKNSKREADTLAHAINYVNKKIGWDMCFFHVHHLDSINHKYLGLVYENSPVYSEAKYEKTWEKIQASYVIVDDMVGNLMENSVDENTIICFITDHGAIPTWKVANIPRALVRSGLLTYKWLHNDNKYIIDWDKTKAFPYMEPPYIWVNLKGRDPQGIVSESEYESVRDQIIESLYQMRDPETGDRIVKLAIKREEAEFLGQNGKRIGDVIFFLNPPYELFDGIVEQLNPANPLPNILVQPDAYDALVCFGAHAYYLPTERVGEYSVSVPLIINGPGIRKGVELKRPVNLIDFAPTISHLLEIPRPKNSIGRVLYEIME